MLDKDVKYGIIAIISIVLIVGFVIMLSGRQSYTASKPSIISAEQSTNVKAVSTEVAKPPQVETGNKLSITELGKLMATEDGGGEITGGTTAWEWFVIGCTAECAIPNCNTQTYKRTNIRDSPDCDIDYGWGLSCRDLITKRTTYNLTWRGFSTYDCNCLPVMKYNLSMYYVNETNVLCSLNGTELSTRCYYGGGLTNKVCGTPYLGKKRYCSFCYPNYGYVPSNSLVGYYKFDSCSGTTVSDSSGFNNYGTVYGANWTSGYKNQGLGFNGVSDKLVITNNKNLLSPIEAVTVEAWIYPMNDIGFHGIAGNWFEGKDAFLPRGYILFQYNDRLLFDIGHNDNLLSVSSSGISNFTNKWHHVVATYNAYNKELKLYVDGVSAGIEAVDSAYSIDYDYLNNTPRIGSYIWNSVETGYFNGKIDEVKIYNYELSNNSIYTDSRAVISGDGCGISPLNLTQLYFYTLTSQSDFRQGAYENINDLNDGSIRIGGKWKKIGYSAGNYFAKANNKLYIIGGDDFEGGPNTVTDELDPLTYNLTHKKNMFLSRWKFTRDELNNKIYVIGGSNSKEIEEFDTLLNQWKILTNSLYPHFGHSSQVYNGKIYFMGSDATGYTQKTEVFDPVTKSVNVLVSMAYGRDKYPSVLLNGKIYAIGGGATNTIEEYDIANNKWTIKKSKLSAPYLRYAQAQAVNNKIYIFGGYEQTSLGGGKYRIYNNNYEFDPLTDTIKNTTPMLNARYRFDSVKLNNFIYAMSGNSPNYTIDAVEMYDPNNNKWIQINPMAEGVRDFDAINYNNKIFVVSGVNSFGSYVDTIQVYALEKQGTFTSPVFNARDSNSYKSFNNIVINFEPLYVNTQLELMYSIDGAPLVSAGIITANGLTTKTFNINKLGKNIQYKVVLTSDDTYLEQHSPAVKDITLNYS